MTPQNKPWAILKVSRKQYCTARPWKNSGMSREQFEQILAVLPEGFIDAIHLGYYQRTCRLGQID